MADTQLGAHDPDAALDPDVDGDLEVAPSAAQDKSFASRHPVLVMGSILLGLFAVLLNLSKIPAEFLLLMLFVVPYWSVLIMKDRKESTSLEGDATEATHLEQSSATDEKALSSDAAPKPSAPSPAIADQAPAGLAVDADDDPDLEVASSDEHDKGFASRHPVLVTSGILLGLFALLLRVTTLPALSLPARLTVTEIFLSLLVIAPILVFVRSYYLVLSRPLEPGNGDVADAAHLGQSPAKVQKGLSSDVASALSALPSEVPPATAVDSISPSFDVDLCDERTLRLTLMRQSSLPLAGRFAEEALRQVEAVKRREERLGGLSLAYGQGALPQRTSQDSLDLACDRVLDNARSVASVCLALERGDAERLDEAVDDGLRRIAGAACDLRQRPATHDDAIVLLRELVNDGESTLLELDRSDVARVAQVVDASIARSERALQGMRELTQQAEEML